MKPCSPILVDCMWGNWTETKCSTTCGDTFKTKNRTIVQTAAFGGRPCKGESLTTQKCLYKPCPGNYTYTAMPYLDFSASKNNLVP